MYKIVWMKIHGNKLCVYRRSDCICNCHFDRTCVWLGKKIAQSALCSVSFRHVNGFLKSAWSNSNALKLALYTCSFFLLLRFRFCLSVSIWCLVFHVPSQYYSLLLMWNKRKRFRLKRWERRRKGAHSNRLTKNRKLTATSVHMCKTNLKTSIQRRRKRINFLSSWSP